MYRIAASIIQLKKIFFFIKLNDRDISHVHLHVYQLINFPKERSHSFSVGIFFLEKNTKNINMTHLNSHKSQQQLLL